MSKTIACRNCGAPPTEAVIGSDNGIEERVTALDADTHTYWTDDRDDRDYAPPIYALCLVCGDSADRIWELMGLPDEGGDLR